MDIKEDVATKETKVESGDGKPSGSSKASGGGTKPSISSKSSGGGAKPSASSKPSGSGTKPSVSSKPSGSKDEGRPSKSSTKRDANGNGHNTVGMDNEVMSQLLNAITRLENSQKKTAEEVRERFDTQSARIAFLTDEWNLKVAANGDQDKEDGKKAVDADHDWQQDSDDEGFRLEEVCDDYDDVVEGDEKEEEEEDDYHELLFGRDPTGLVPTQEEVAIFKKRTRLGDEFGEEEWRDQKAKNVAKYFNGRAEARDFAAPLADMDAPDLKYKNRKTNEKEMYECHKQMGAINLAQIKLAEETKGLMTNAGITMGEFASPDVIMNDPRQEAAQSFEGVKNTALEMMKLVGSIGKMATVVYMRLLTMRRSQFVESVTTSKVARDMVKRLKPSTRYLFGDNLKTVCRTLKEGSQLSSALLQRPGGRGGSGHRGGRGGYGRGGYGRGARGGHHGGNRGSGFRGGFRPRGGKAKKT